MRSISEKKLAKLGGKMPFSSITSEPKPLPRFYILSGREMVRCTQTEGLEHHHKTYSRYGGNELPTDILKVCKPHHDYLESLKPAGNRRSRRIA